MQPTIQVRDALWYFVYPFASLHRRRWLLPRTGSTNVITRRTAHFQQQECCPQTSLRTGPKARCPRKSSPHLVGRRSIHDTNAIAPAVWQTYPNRSKEPKPAPTDETLHQLALNGEYPGVQEHVEHLVKERGEKPNIGIYHALVLANTNCKHGSAGEVTRLLQDMAEEGINPDSATLHAVLRVRDYSTDLSLRTKARTGPCSTSGFSTANPCRRRASPTLVFVDKRGVA